MVFMVASLPVFRCSGIQVFRIDKDERDFAVADPEHLNTRTPEYLITYPNKTASSAFWA
jgi:hypothetical protein